MQSSKTRSTDPRDHGQQITALDQFASMTSYTHWVPADDWDADASILGATVSYVEPTSTVPGHWLFSGASEEAEYVYYYLRRPENWHRGHLDVVVHFGGSATGNFSAIVGFSLNQHNAAISAFTDKSTTIAVPTSGTTRLLLARPKATLDTSFGSSATASSEINPKAVGAYASTVPPIHDGIYVRFGRDATSDENAGNLRFYGLEILFFPHEGVVGHAFVSDYYREETRP